MEVRGNLSITNSVINAPLGLVVEGGSLTLRNVTLKAPVHVSGMSDMVTLDAGSFSGDSVTVIGDHCAFHFNGGQSAGIGAFQLTNSAVKSSVYGFMILGGAPQGTKAISHLSISNTANGIESAGERAHYRFTGVTFTKVQTPKSISNPSTVTVTP